MTRCRICGQEIPLPIVINNGMVLCPEHKREQKRRHSAGVSSEQLSEQWGDLLNHWSACPAELRVEFKRRSGATRFAFVGRAEDWLLFTRSYIVWTLHRDLLRKFRSALTGTPSNQGIIYAKSTLHTHLRGRGSRARMPAHRMGDILAVHSETGEIRRFVDVTEQEARDDLLGVRSAPHQEELAHFWGNRAPTGWREEERDQLRQRVFGPGHRLLIANLLQEGSFPVYGLVNNPLDLTLQGVGWSGGGSSQVGSISLHFSSLRYTSTDSHFDLTSGQANQPGIYSPPENDEAMARQFDQHLFFSLYAFNERARQEPIAEPVIWRGEVLIEGETFSGFIRAWSEPEAIARFQFASGDMMLSGQTRGPLLDEVQQLIKGLAVINQRDDLLAQYQRETDEAREKLFAH